MVVIRSMKKYIKHLLIALEHICDGSIIERDEALTLLNNLNLTDARDISYNLNNDLFHIIAKNVKDNDLLYLILNDIGVERLKQTKLSYCITIKDEIIKKYDDVTFFKCNLKLSGIQDMKYITASVIYNEFTGSVVISEWV